MSLDKLRKLTGELNDLETAFRDIFYFSSDLMCVVSEKGYFTMVNPAFTRELGWSDKDLISKPFIDFIHPDDLSATQQVWEDMANGVPATQFENRYLCKDGGTKTLVWNANPINIKGTAYAIARIKHE